MDFKLTSEEEAKTAAITTAAYNSWVLVNDYFSWEKEWRNYNANGGTGVIANAIFLYMRWYSIEREEGKKMLRKEIVAREEKYCKLKSEFLAKGNVPQKLRQWLELLDLVTAGNFAWSMTTARYRHGAEDAYPSLRLKCSKPADVDDTQSLSNPISLNAAEIADKIDVVLSPRRYLDLSKQERPSNNVDMTRHSQQPSHAVTDFKKSQISQIKSVYQYEDVSELKTDRNQKQSNTPQMILQPEAYLRTLPSKGVRNAIIDGLEIWYQVPEKSLAVIRDIVNLLHSSSLM